MRERGGGGGGVNRSSGGPYGCHGNPPQPSTEAARVTLPSGEQQGQKERGLRRGIPTKGSTSTRQRERV